MYHERTKTSCDQHGITGCTGYWTKNETDVSEIKTAL